MRVPLHSYVFVVMTTLLANASGQHLHWKHGHPIGGSVGLFGGSYACVRWDPDGAGPGAPVLVFGGTFTIPAIDATNLAWFDPATDTWGAFASSPNGEVRCLSVMADGRLAIGGQFTLVGELAARGAAIFDGEHWNDLAGGVDAGSIVRAMQALPNGDLAVGGQLSRAGLAHTGVLRWDGLQWHDYGQDKEVTAMSVTAGGHLLIAGPFGGNIAEWDGFNWAYFPPGIGGAPTNLLGLANGNIAAAGTQGLVWVWDGSWQAIGAGALVPLPTGLAELANGDLLVSGVARLGSGEPRGVVRWDGAAWQAYAPGMAGTQSLLLLPNGDLVAAIGGPYYAPPQHRCGARWDGQQWQALGDGFDAQVAGTLALPNGDVLLFGPFTRAPGAALSSVVRWTGESFHAYPPLLLNSQPVGGTVGPADQPWLLTTQALLRWTGIGWQSTGSITSGRCVVASAAGEPLVGGAEPTIGGLVRRWGGSSWQTVGLFDGAVRALCVLPGGDLIAGGDFAADVYGEPMSHIARYDGVTWQPIGAGLDGSVRAVATLPNGDLVAAGDFNADGAGTTSLLKIARWNGTTWLPLGVGFDRDVRALLVMPDGDLLAGGSFTTADALPARGLARWRGGLWTPVDGGVDGIVETIAQRPNGDVVIGGTFPHAGGHPSAYFALARTSWPAAAAVLGAGCSGSSGALTLLAQSLPWLGTTYRATCYGAPTGALGLTLFGASPAALPLASLLPVAAPGCALLVMPDLLLPSIVTGGAVTVDLPLPRAVALLGVGLWQQTLTLRSDPVLGDELLSSNALGLLFGAL
ncbi:MAG: hypothetical protein JNN13_16220 [Planctomycetes bacterium]|nr:hypothetical protein [Planctomycetota bacterium]